MSERKIVRLGELCSTITKGTTPSNIGESFTDTGIKYIRSEMITTAKYVTGDFLHISHKTHEKLKRSQLFSGDILFSIAGAYLGKTAIIRPEDTPANTNQAVALIRIDSNRANNEYIYYYLNLPEIVRTSYTIQSQSAQPNINLKQISELKIILPDRIIQDRIASLLSAYDDLIENNQRQIKLLEEAAQRLYKEWFADLRYPGHENVPVVDGLPEDWAIKKIADISSINKSSIGKDYPHTTIKYIDISSVEKGHISNKTTYDLKDAPGRARRLAHDGDIIWSMVRPNLRAFALVQYPDKIDVFSTGFAILSPEKVPSSYLYCTVTTDKFVGYLVSCTNGAAYPAVKPVHFAEADIVVPSVCILQEFDKLAKPMFRKIHQLALENIHLSEARDRLLPKLMSGEIAV